MDSQEALDKLEREIRQLRIRLLEESGDDPARLFQLRLADALTQGTLDVDPSLIPAPAGTESSALSPRTRGRPRKRTDEQLKQYRAEIEAYMRESGISTVSGALDKMLAEIDLQEGSTVGMRAPRRLQKLEEIKAKFEPMLSKAKKIKQV